MKIVYGIAMGLIALIFGLYFGGWICIIGGLMQIIREIKLAEIGSIMGILSVALGILKVCAGAVSGWVAVHLIAIPGYNIAKD